MVPATDRSGRALPATRLKDNAYLVVERRSAEEKGILADEIIAMEKQAQADTETAPFLRACATVDDGRQRGLRRALAAICNERWHIERRFSGAETESAHEGVRGHDGQCTEDANPDSTVGRLAVEDLQRKTKFRWSLARADRDGDRNGSLNEAPRFCRRRRTPVEPFESPLPRYRGRSTILPDSTGLIILDEQPTWSAVLRQRTRIPFQINPPA